METLPDDHKLPFLSQTLSLLNSLWSEKVSSLCLGGRKNHSCGGNIKIRCVLSALAVSVDARSFMITSSSPSLYIFCCHIKAHVLKLLTGSSLSDSCRQCLCLCDTAYLLHITLLGCIWRDLLEYSRPFFFCLFFLFVSVLLHLLIAHHG